jgi:hypothetical protein
MAPASFAIVGFVGENRAVFADDSELRLSDVGHEPTNKSTSVAASLLARAPASVPALMEPEERGTRLLAKLLETKAIELTRKADRRELAEHLDEMFASRRMTPEAVASVLEDHDSVAELYADDETLATLLAEIDRD